MAEQKQLNIYHRLNAVRSKVGYLKKDAEMQGQKGVTHDLVTSAVREHLIENGIIVVPRQLSGESFNVGQTQKGATIIRYEAAYEVDFVNCDDPQDRVTVPIQSHANDHGDKAPGKACSYAVKYAMLKLFSIETGENEESRIEIADKMRPITEEQALTIQAMLEETDSDPGRFVGAFAQRFSCPDVKKIEDIPKFLYDDAISLIESKAKRQAETQE